MATLQTKKQSDLEKRLKLLRTQLSGKYTPDKSIYKVSDIKTGVVTSQTSQSDISYLYQDLRKIGILASLALGTQIILLILSKNNLIKLNF